MPYVLLPTGGANSGLDSPTEMLDDYADDRAEDRLTEARIWLKLVWLKLVWLKLVWLKLVWLKLVWLKLVWLKLVRLSVRLSCSGCGFSFMETPSLCPWMTWLWHRRWGLSRAGHTRMSKCRTWRLRSLPRWTTELIKIVIVIVNYYWLLLFANSILILIIIGSDRINSMTELFVN